MEAAPPPNSAVAPPGVVTCVLLLSPLRGRDGQWRAERRTFPVGDTVDAYLPSTEVLDRVVLNGGVIPPEHYACVRPQAGDELWLYPTWGYVPGLTEALVSIAIGLLITTVSHFLFRPKPNLLPTQNHLTETTEEPTFSFEGIRTAIGPGGVVPVVYGRHRIGGQLLAAAVDQAVIYSDDGVVVPAFPVTAVQYGEPQNIVIVTAPGNDFQTNQHVILQGLIGKPALNSTWQIRKLEGDPDSFVLLFSWGVNIETPYGGGGTATLVGTGGPRTLQALANPPTLSLFLGLCEGPISEIIASSIQINGQPFANFPGVQVFAGAGFPTEPAWAEFGGARNTFADGRTIVPEGVTYTSNGPLHAFILNLVFAQGLYFINEKGEKESNSVYFEYRWAPAGTGAWSPPVPFTVSADRTAPVRLGIRRENLPFQAYDIQIARGGPQHTDELRARFEPTLESVTEYLPNTDTYPYTAWLGLRALATDQLRGALPNITVEVRGRSVRVGTLVPSETWSDNPAWCVLDMLTNKRYGRGVPDSDIDLQAFALYAAYCDQVIDGEPRHTLNIVLDRETRAQQFFLETMGGSRGMLLKSGGLWQPRPTRAETPVMLLSWTMVSNVTLTYLRDVDEINVMEARFSNQDADFEQDVLTWPALAQWPPEIHKASLDLRGVTKPSRIVRALQFELNRRRYENVLLELDASAEALPMQIHDLFRFSHPLPGWGTSGRMQAGSTTTTIVLDEPCVIESGVNYVVYVRYVNDAVEARNVVPAVLGTVRHLVVATPLSAIPEPGLTIWVFGRLDSEANTRIFRVTALQRKSDTTVHLEAVIHNPSIYDDPLASPLPVITTLYNPQGPPPPIVSLVATELTRIQASGASLRVVNLSWDVAELSSGYAPYGGATLLRRTVLSSGQLGQAQGGIVDLGAIVDPNDPNVNYVPLAQVRGHVLDFDDYTVISGGTYQYRVVPVSALGVPNNVGSREVLIQVTGPTIPGYFPGTPRNLRLRGQAVGATEWEGRDCHVEWDAVAPSPLFSETFFVQHYEVQIWAPEQLYLLRSTTVAGNAPNQAVQWTYSYEQNYEDQLHAGYASARRDFEVWVWARTNTGLLSLDPAHILVINPPPDMSSIVPDTTALFEAALINFNQWAEPRDLHHYEVYLDIVNPPVAIYQDVSIAFRKLFPAGLQVGVTYYTYILPYDTFGPGLPSQTSSFIPLSITSEMIGIGTITETNIADDAISTPKLRANSVVASKLVTDVAVITTAAQIANALIGDAHITNLSASKIAAGQIGVQVTVGGSSNVFGSNIFLDGTQRAIFIYDESATLRLRMGRLSPADYGLQIWNSTGGLMWDFESGAQTLGLANLSVTDAKIQNLSATKITAGTIQAAVFLGVGGGVAQASNIVLDGLNRNMVFFDNAGTTRVLLGHQGSNVYGLSIWNALGQLMWHFGDGAQTLGIAPNAVTESLLYTSVGTISVTTSETVIASLTYGTLQSGDQVWVSASATVACTGGRLTLRLREDSIFGSEMHRADFTPGSTTGVTTGLTVQAVFTAVSVLAGKIFAFTLVNSQTGDAVAAQLMSMVALRRQR
jgi:hypothetical protein